MDKLKHWVKKLSFKNVTQWVCPYLTQNWVKTTQHFLECKKGYFKYISNNYVL